MTRWVSEKTNAPNEQKTIQVLPPLNERMSIEEMLFGFTLNGAKQLGIEAHKGSIEVGRDTGLEI